MGETTMNLHATTSTLALPCSSRLLPPESSDQLHPPIYLKLNSNVLEILAQTHTEPEVKLLLSDKGAALRINDKEFHGTQYKEPGHVEVYLPLKKESTRDSFLNFGEIATRILIKSEKPKKVCRKTENLDLVPPTEEDVVQLLKKKPHSLESLQQETNASSSALQIILSNVATRTDKGFYTIKSNTPKYKAKAQSLGRRTGGLKTHRESEATVVNSAVEDPSNEKHYKVVRKLIKRETPQVQKPLNQPLAALATVKRKAGKLAESCKKVKKSDSKAEMYELARKFQNAYGEYLELYSFLSKRKTRPPSQVEKLMEMHNQLTQWKETLWSNSRMKSQVK